MRTTDATGKAVFFKPFDLYSEFYLKNPKCASIGPSGMLPFRNLKVSPQQVPVIIPHTPAKCYHMVTLLTGTTRFRYRRSKEPAPAGLSAHLYQTGVEFG